MPDLRVGCNTAGYLRESLDRALDGIAAEGIRYIEFGSILGYIEHLIPSRMSREDTRALLDALTARELVALSVSAGADLATEAGYEFIDAWLTYAPQIGVQFINTGSGPCADPDRRAAVVDNLRRLAPTADRQRVYVALETQDDVTVDGEAAARLLADVGSDWVCLNLDAANMLYWQGTDPLSEINQLAPHIRHVHVKDKVGGKGKYDFPPVGQGEIDWSAILRALFAAGFDGPLVLDPELWREEAKTAAEIAEAELDPALTYQRPHGYLGVDDPAISDRYISESARALNVLLSELGIPST